MKILQVCARIPFPVEDGGSVYVYNTMKNLSNIGNDMFMASFNSELHSQDASSISHLTNISHLQGRFTAYNILSILKSELTRQPITIQHRMSKRIMSEILQKLPNSFDVVLFEGLHTTHFLPLIREKFRDTTCVLRHVNVEYILYRLNARNESNPLKKLFLYDQSNLMKKYELNAINQVDAISFISDEDKNTLTPYLYRDIPTIVNEPGVDTISNIPFEGRKDNQIIAFANWKWTPNLDGIKWFLEFVWPSILRKKPAIKLILAGIELPKNVQMNLPKNVEYIGFVEDLKTFCTSSTIQIVPLRSGSGIKLKVLEGFAFGNVIVSTKFGVQGINAKEGVHYEQADDQVSFCNKIIQLLDDKQKREAISKNAFNLVKDQYTWEQKIKDLDKFLKVLVNK